MEQYTVTGMSCAACQARVENALKAVAGVTAVTVDLEKGTAAVTGQADTAALSKAVTDAGYTVTEVR